MTNKIQVVKEEIERIKEITARKKRTFSELMNSIEYKLKTKTK